MVDHDSNGSSPNAQSAAWRALHTEGILWDGPVAVIDGTNQLPLRLIATTQRLAFTRGGEFVLDIPREWLTPPPHMHPDGSVNLTVDAGEGSRPERLRLIARDGRRLAVDLVAALNKSRPPRNDRTLRIYAPDATENIAELPAPASPNGSERGEPLAVLAVDDFSAPSGASHSVPIFHDDALAAPVYMSDLVPPPREANWSLQPIVSTRTDRIARRSWAIRLSGLIALLVIAAAFGSGRMPTLPGRELTTHLPDTSIEAPFSSGDHEPTEAPAIARVETTTPTNTPVPVGPTGTTGVDNGAVTTLAPSETAVALGVGGMDSETETARSLEVTSESSVTPTPTATSTNEPTPEPTDEPTEVSAAGDVDPTEEPTATTEPSEAPTAEPTVAPTNTHAPKPTSTTEPAPPTVTVPPPEPVSPTEVPVTAEPTVAPSATSEPTATPTPEPTATATLEPSPTATSTSRPSFPAQEATLGEGELPAQVFSSGGFRYTVESAVRAPRIDSLALTPVKGFEWVAVLLYAENWSDENASLVVADHQLLTYGTYGVLGVTLDPVTEVISETLNLKPVMGADDSTLMGPGDGQRLALVYLIRPDSTVLHLTTGETTIDLSSSLGGIAAMTDPGAAPQVPDLVPVTVTEVLDGQSIMVETEDGARTRVKYLGVEAPIGNACYASKSKRANADIIAGQTVYLERERKNRAPNSRIARDVWMEDADGNLTLVAAELAAGGSVVAAPAEPDVRFAGWIEAAEEGAVGSGLGLWGACGGLQTPEPEVVGAVPPEQAPVAIEQAMLAYTRS